MTGDGRGKSATFMHDPRINLKDPWLAAILGWLVPGLGHFYQGRTFKGAVYAVCILGLFLSGWAMADWSAVQPPDVQRPLANKTLLLKYTAQLGVGLPSIYGLVQSKRFNSPDNRPTSSLSAPVESEFKGSLLPLDTRFPETQQVTILLSNIDVAQVEVEGQSWPLDHGIPAAGQLALSPMQTELGSPSIKAEFTGTVDGQPADVRLKDVFLEEPIRSSPRRRVFAVAEDAKSGAPLGILVASVPRSAWNFLSVPMSPREENQMHGRHGNFLEIWLVFTWIAGLLNMLAVWDAFDGPAYAYGDEDASRDDPEGADKPAPGQATIENIQPVAAG